MSEESEELPEEEECENQCGLILGCWDHEKTPTLIQDLEQSVNLVEKKCTKLFEELLYYKKYLEQSGENNFQLAVLKKTTKKSKNSQLFSGSEPDIAFRKNLINIKEIRQVFEEKFQAKLTNINKELREAAHKIGLKDNIILLHANDYLKALNSETECDTEQICYDEPEELVTLNLCTTRTKSDPIIPDHLDDAEISKITQNELALYQNLSRLSMNRRKKKKKLQGRKMKFCLMKKTPRCRQGFVTCRTESLKRKSRKIKLKKSKRGTTVPQRDGSRSPRDSQRNWDEPEIEKMCKSLNEAIGINKLRRSEEASKGHEPAADGSGALEAALRKTVPFTACASTSKSYNLGVNLQQLLFMSKQERKSKTLEKSRGPNKNKLEDGTTSKKTENGCWIPDSNNVYENGQVNQVEHKGKVWISDNNKLNFRKVRSKYTGTSREGFVEYHKSTMSQYTNGRKSMIKSESKRAYAVGSKIMFSDCQRTDVFEVHRDGSCFENASGDCTFNAGYDKLNSEWIKVHNSFLDIYRKYTSLKEKLTGDHLEHADGELQSLENEIDYSIEKYKDFLQFYSKFLHLNHRLKSLKLACQSKMFEPVTSFSSNFHRKFRSYRPTHSAAMKRALREVQTLQDKINLVDECNK